MPGNTSELSHPAEIATTDRYGPRYTTLLLQRMSPTNRSTVRKYLMQKERSGIKASSIKNSAWHLHGLDKTVQGAPFGDLTPDDLAAALSRYAQKYTPASVDCFAAHVKAFYAWANGGECPGPIRVAMRRRATGSNEAVQIIAEHEFDALLDAAADNPRPGRAAYHTALLWTLWDSGFRISEALALRVGSVTFDDAGVWLQLPHDAPDLKTGPRRIYVTESRAALRAWIAAHPERENPNAPLFPAPTQPGQSVLRTTVYNMIERIALRAKILPPHPHLFRHTRATRCARAEWTEPQLRAFFGWGPQSPMPSRYVHLAAADVRNRVLKDARAPEANRPVAAPAAPAVPVIAAPSVDVTAISAAVAAAIAAVQSSKV